MLIEPILGYKSTLRILSLLFETPRKPISRKELFEYTNLGNAPLSRGLSRLIKSNIIIQKKEGKKEFYYMNLENPYTKLIKELWQHERDDSRQLEYDIKIIISEFIRPLLEIANIQEVILFGSWAKGTASTNSDLDLAIIFENKIESEIEITNITNKIEQKFKKELQLHYFTKETFNEKNNLISEIKKDGIKILG